VLSAEYWNQFERTHCFVMKRCNCEPLSDTIILQPISVVSSFPYVFVGAYFLWKSRERFLSFGPFTQLALLFIFTGLASIFNHASYLQVAELCDYGGIFMIFFWTAAMAQKKRRTGAVFFAQWVFPAAVAIGALSLLYGHGRAVFVVVIAIALSQVILFHRRSRESVKARPFLVKAVGCLALGLVLHVLDMDGKFCFDAISLHGHTVWHLLTAASMVYIYRYFEAMI